MTEREQERYRIAREKILERDNYTCICGESVYSRGGAQLAHVISKSKTNIKKYGEDVINHPLNIVSVCCLECNSKVNIGTKPETERALIKLIQEELRK